MILARKIDGNNIYLKLSLFGDDNDIEDGFVKLKLKKSKNSNSCFDSITTKPTYSTGVTSKFTHRSKSKNKSTIKHFPSNNLTVKRIFQSISNGNYQEVEYSIRFVCFNDFYYNNVTVAITSLFCTNVINRRIMIKLLMKLGFNFHMGDLIFHRDPIHWACIMGYNHEFYCIITYLNWLVDYHKQDVDGNTYLHLAVMSNSFNIVEALSTKMNQNIIRADISNNVGLTPYILSRKLGHREISNYLEQNNSIVSVNVCDNVSYRTPREWSILGQVARQHEKPNTKILKMTNYKNIETFKLPDIEENQTPKIQNSINMNRVIHAAYISWSQEHVDSFRKFIKSNEQSRKNQPCAVLPHINRKAKFK